MATRTAMRKRLAPPGTYDSHRERQTSSLDTHAAESLLHILSRVAIVAQLAEKREIPEELVQKALSSTELEQWNTLLADPRGMPLVKVIEEGADVVKVIEEGADDALSEEARAAFAQVRSSRAREHHGTG